MVSFTFLALFLCLFHGTRSFDYFQVSAIHERIQKHGDNCTDIISFFLKRAYRYNPLLNAIISFNPNALKEAHVLDKFYRENRILIGKLHCIPILVKDNIAVKDMPTTAGIKAMRHMTPNIDAYVVGRLKAEGGIVIGKSNLAEMAISAYDSETGGACKNPWDTDRTCSRSSSGSACGIAAGMALISLGTDTTGSIMGPASSNGVFGLRPIHGETNTDGVIIARESDDTIGPFAGHVDDIVLTYSIMSNEPSLYANYMSTLSVKPRDVRIGYLKNFIEKPLLINITDNDYFIYKMDNEVHDAFDDTISDFKKLNIEVVEMEMSDRKYDELAQELKNIVLTRTSGCSNQCLKGLLDMYLGNQERFDVDSPYRSFDDFKQSPLLSDYFVDVFNKSNTDVELCKESCKPYYELRNRFRERVDSWFKLSSAPVDLLLFPTMVVIPDYLDDKENVNRFSATMVPSFTGYSSLSIPAKFSTVKPNAPDGLPIGMMLISTKENFLKMLKVASFYESAYLRNKALPKSVPLLEDEDKCASNTAWPSHQSRSIIIMLLLSAFYFWRT